MQCKSVAGKMGRSHKTLQPAVRQYAIPTTAKQPVNTEDRFIAIEIKLSRQEDLVDILNEQVVRQQKQIDALETLCAALARQIQSASRASLDTPAAHEPPPHY